MTLPLPVKRLHPSAILPTRGSRHAAGLDLYAPEAFTLRPGERRTIPTGIAVAIPPGHYGRVAPRSGLANRYGVDVLAGVVDPDFRGELCAILLNTGGSLVAFKTGDRIAQLLVEQIATPDVVETDDLDETVRGEQGFGSSGR